MMQTVKKIIITGDFMRQNVQGGSSQNINIRWLYNLLHPILGILTHLPIKPIYFDGDQNCLGTKLYQSNHMEINFESWVSLYEKEPTERDLAYMYDRMNDSLVISFELSEFVRKGLDRLRIPYIDFTVHPARFMDDLLFGVRTNLMDLTDALQEWIVSEEEIFVGAGLALSTLGRLPKLKVCENPEPIALFAAQSTDDKVLIRNGRLMQGEDFLDSFSDMSKKHDQILVKPHPYVKVNPVITALTRLFPNTKETDANFYHLLVHDTISHVYSFTSSTSYEASYLGKQGIHLAPYPYTFTDTNGVGGHYLQIHPQLYLPQFWEKILRLAGMEVKPYRPVHLAPDRNRMRRSLRNFWGADIFEMKL